MSNRFAHFLSYLFHPLLLATWLCLVVGLFSPQLLFMASRAFPLLLGFIFLYSFIIPVLAVYQLKRWGLLTDFLMQNHRERVFPFALTTLIYASFCLFLYLKLPFFHSLFQVLLGITFTIASIALISYWSKISAHAAGMGGIVGILLYFYVQSTESVFLYLFLGSIILSGFVISGRLQLHAHTLKEVFLGFMVGFLLNLWICFSL